MYVHLESLNKKRLNLFWLNFSKDRSLSRAGTVICSRLSRSFQNL
jgi:hypothetical protein